jgi:general stress protein CsbA
LPEQWLFFGFVFVILFTALSVTRNTWRLWA